MSVNLELLTKAAKVYDCSEPVEGMKPKMQYEEHKDLTPDEFSREHTNKAEEKSSAFAYDNSGVNQWNAMRSNYDLPKNFGLAGAGLGALTGGLYGASTAKKGKRTGAILRGLLGGALTGGAGGLGAGFAVRNAMPEAQPQGVGTDIKALKHLLTAKSDQDFMDSRYRDIFGKSKVELEEGLGRGALLGGGAGLLGGGLLTGAMMPEEKDEEDETPTKKSSLARVLHKLAFTPHQPAMQTGESGAAHPLNAINAANETMRHYGKAYDSGNAKSVQGYAKQYQSLMQSASDANQQIGGPAIPVRPLPSTITPPATPPTNVAAPKPPVAAPQPVTKAAQFGVRAAHAILPTMEQAFWANSRRSVRN